MGELLFSTDTFICRRATFHFISNLSVYLSTLIPTQQPTFQNEVHHYHRHRRLHGCFCHRRACRKRGYALFPPKLHYWHLWLTRKQLSPFVRTTACASRAPQPASSSSKTAKRPMFPRKTTTRNLHMHT